MDGIHKTYNRGSIHLQFFMRLPLPARRWRWHGGHHNPPRAGDWSVIVMDVVLRRSVTTLRYLVSDTSARNGIRKLLIKTDSYLSYSDSDYITATR